MSQEIIINADLDETRIALIDNQVIQEIYIARENQKNLVGNIYKGKVQRLLLGIQAAFIDVGLERPGFLPLLAKQFVHPGQEIMVQVVKDALLDKGVRLTTQISLPTRYLVLTPQVLSIQVSQRITDNKERNRLQAMLTATEQGGFVLRTAALHVSDQQIMRDKDWLVAEWDVIKAKMITAKVGDIVYQDISLPLRILRDVANENLEKIIVDSQLLATQIAEFTQQFIPALTPKINLHTDPTPIFDKYGIEKTLQNALQRKVELKSGGYVLFDQTAAMTTIDVNTGTAVKEQSILQTNLEAVAVIAHQLRLRNLGGIIVIDFVDMADHKAKEKVLQQLALAAAQDSVRVEISELSSLGLVQLTRKRTRESLANTLCVTCPTCEGRAVIKSYATLSQEIFREIRRTASLFPKQSLQVIAPQKLITYLTERKKDVLATLEKQCNIAIKLQVDENNLQEPFCVLPS